MSDVTETLQQLMERRLRELGARRGRDALSLREAYLSLPESEGGERPVSYEAVRRVLKKGHTNIEDRTADAIATMLDVAVGDVLTAAGQRRRLGRFELPRRADRLEDDERKVVVAVVDAILAAGEGRGRQPAPAAKGTGGAGKPALPAEVVRAQLLQWASGAKSEQQRAVAKGLLAELDQEAADPGTAARDAG